jgi:membrane fusion protein (multidrug efflux system)
VADFRIGLRRALVLLVLLSAGAVGQTQVPKPAVTVAPVEVKDVTPSWEFIGRVEAIQSVDLRARVQGVLQQIAFQEGQDVTAGQLLYVIEPDPYQAAVDAARAQLAKAKAALANAERTLSRTQQLSSRGFEAQANLDKARADRDSAAADVQAAEANLRTAELNLSYTRITSTIDGRIGHTAVTVGNLVGPDTGVLDTVVQLDPIRVVFSVDDRALLQVKTQSGGASEEELKTRFVPALRLADGSMYPEQGVIEFADNRVDPATATVPVRAAFGNPRRLLLPGQFVAVVIKQDASERKPVVPVAAVQEDRDGKFVLIVGPDNRVEQRRIVANRQVGQEWVVESGLRQGETVIVEGVQKVQPGGEVTPIPAGQAPSAERRAGPAATAASGSGQPPPAAGGSGAPQRAERR